MKTKRSNKARGAHQRLAAKKASPKPRRRAASLAVSAEPGTPAIDPRWRWHYRELTNLRAQLLADRAEKLHEAALMGLEPHSLHMADSATDEFDRDMIYALLAAELNALSEVEDAIQRILAGTYGVCEATGKRISAARLRAVPWTRFARDAEQKLEKTGVVPRPHLDHVTSIRGLGEVIPESTEFEQSAEEEPEETVPEELTALEVRGEEAEADATAEPVASDASPTGSKPLRGG